jgi:hypothetical protein
MRNHFLSYFLFGAIVWTLASLILHAQTQDAAPGHSIFTELFDDKSSIEKWQIDKGTKPFGSISWSNVAINRGLTVNAPGTWVALAKCNFGTDPFDFWFDTILTQGNTAPWRYNGFAIALCSAPPGEMTDHDIAVTVGFHQAGVEAAVKKGPFYKPGLNIKLAPKFATVDTATRYEMSMAGAGGESFSILWPKEALPGTRMRCHLRRLADNLVHIEIYNADGDFSRPWWIGEQKLPDALASCGIKYVAVLTTEEVPESNIAPPPRAVIEGRITNMRGWSGTPSVPEIQSYSAPGGLAVDKEFTVTGTNFSPDASVLLNGTHCPVKSATSTELKVTARGLLPTGLNSLQIVNGNNLASALYEPGVYAGHYLAAVEPYEALPEGGDGVTVRGAGFDASTHLTFNGNAADLVKVLSDDAVQVKVPAGNAGVAVVSANGFDGHPRFGYAPHPFMVFKGKEGRAAKQAQFNDPAFAPYRQALLRLTDQAIMTPETRDLNISPEAGKSIIDAMGAWCFTGDAKYKDAVLSAYRLQCEGVAGAYPSKVFNYPGMIQQPLERSEFWIMNGAGIAEMYDAMFEDFTPEQRARIEHYLDDHLSNYTDRLAAKDWWYASDSNPSNTVAVANGCGGTIALSLRYSRPENDAIALKAADAITQNYHALLEDGGCVEGNLYWDYGVGHQIDFGYMLENTLGNDHELLSAPRMQKMVHFMETQLGGDGNLFTFNDTQPWLCGAIPCALGASRFDQPLMRWGCDEIARRGAAGGQNLISLIAFLLRDTKPMLDKVPDLPTVAAMPLLNWGVLRSSPQACGSGLVVGVKGVGGAQTHHHQEDAGSFVLQSRGESFLIDPGYYQGTASEHTLPQIGPPVVAASAEGRTASGDARIESKAPPVLDSSAPAPLSDIWEEGDLRSITVDATQAYNVKGDKKAVLPIVRRILVMDGEKAVVTLDQVEPVNVEDGITSFYQGGFDTDAIPEKGFRIMGMKSDLVALFDGPASEFTVEKMKFGNDWVYSQMGVHWCRVTSPYKYAADLPRIGLFLPLDKGANPPVLNVKRTENHISVSIPGGDSIEFQKTGADWKAVKPIRVVPQDGWPAIAPTTPHPAAVSLP